MLLSGNLTLLSTQFLRCSNSDVTAFLNFSGFIFRFCKCLIELRVVFFYKAIGDDGTFAVEPFNVGF